MAADKTGGWIGFIGDHGYGHAIRLKDVANTASGPAARGGPAAELAGVRCQAR